MVFPEIETFLYLWADSARTSLGFFWMALWAFIVGYLISSVIQVFVTRERMRRAMGDPGPRSMALATLFGFASSSCSFAALATTKSLFRKGAGLAPSLAFMLASTNLVVELGIVIAVFLTWQFIVAEYVGGLLLILAVWLLLRLTRPSRLVDRARERLGGDSDDEEVPDWRRMIRTREGWARVGHQFAMEWKMVWKDVTLGFTAAGIIATFVPPSFFRSLFVGSGAESAPGFGEVVLQALVGPVAAFFTFIGSMGNIPLAAVLYSNGVAFAGIMAFIFSDLVVLPVLRINARYYGWRMALYILVVLLTALVTVAVVMHYGFAATGHLPEVVAGGTSILDREYFSLDYKTVLNLVFLAAGGITIGLWRTTDVAMQGHEMVDRGTTERVLFALSMIAYAWLAVGVVLLIVLP